MYHFCSRSVLLRSSFLSHQMQPSFRRNWGTLWLQGLEVSILILTVLLNSGWFLFLWHRLGRRWCAVNNRGSKSLNFERQIHRNDLRDTIKTQVLEWDAQAWLLQYWGQNWLEVIQLTTRSIPYFSYRLISSTYYYLKHSLQTGYPYNGWRLSLEWDLDSC